VKKVLKSGFFDPARHRERVFFRTRGVFGKIRKKRTTEEGHRGVTVGKQQIERQKNRSKNGQKCARKWQRKWQRKNLKNRERRGGG